MQKTGWKKICVGTFAFIVIILFSMHLISVADSWDKEVQIAAINAYAPIVSQCVWAAVWIIGILMGANVAEWGFKTWNGVKK